MTTEDLLTRTLHEVTEHTDYPSTSLATVARRARVVRGRRRRTTALAAAAAAAAIVTPGALWLNRSPGSSSEPTVAPTATPSPTASTGPSGSLSDLTSGRDPGIDYLDGDTYVGMGGGNLTDPVLRRASTVSLGRGGLLVAQYPTLPDDRIGDLLQQSDQGDQRLGCGAARFAISADRVESAYWVMDSCTTGSAGRLYTGSNNTMGEAGPTPAATPAGLVVQPIGFVRQGVVADLGTPNHADDRGVWIYGPQGGPTRVPGLSTAGGTDQSDDLVAGQLASDPGTGIVVHASSGVPVAYVPGWTLGQFSPDGKYVLGRQPHHGEPDAYAVFDATTGDKVTDVGMTAGGGLLVRQVAWDVDDTVLAVASDGRSSDDAIVRFDLHGHATLATQPKPAADPSFPVYRLATRP